MNKIFFITFLFLASCANSQQKSAEIPSWYISPKPNNSQNLYGVAEGYSLEEATKYALADAAARLMVNISAESNLIREENQNSVNEEMRQQVRQSIEKISFTNFSVSRSDKLAEKFFVEVEIEREPFLLQQQERVEFLEKRIANLDQDSLDKNLLHRRDSLIKILDLLQELELKSRILAGAKEKVNLTKVLNQIAFYQNQFDKTSTNIEFYFEANSVPEIAQIIKNSLNKEKIKLSSHLNSANRNQIVLKIKSNIRYTKIDNDFLAKLTVNFENFSNKKILASNSVEIRGASVIGEKEAYFSALEDLKVEISKNGILKIIGIN